MPSAFFHPDSATTDRVLHRFADHEVTFHDIADEFGTTVPALVLWLSKPDIAQRIADLRSAGAERTRTIAALYLPRTIPVLMRIIDSHDHDIGHRLDDPRDPATLILKLRERESLRKAITLIYRLANFTDKPAVPRVARTSGLPVRSASDAPSPHTADLGPTEVGARATSLSDTLHAESVVLSSPGRSEATPWVCDQRVDDSLGVVVGTDTTNNAVPRLAAHKSLFADLPLAFSRSNPNSASALLQRAGTTPRRSRAGPQAAMA